ncbi:hypothetical protein [Streptomyces fradiae]|uniref:hypothetical protein n=1 Tax=Streptomyces fradiae TaxID=1906 RepID=UPI003674CB9D
MPQLPGADTTMWDKASTSIFRKLIDQDTSDQVGPKLSRTEQRMNECTQHPGTPPSAQFGVHIQHVIEELRTGYLTPHRHLPPGDDPAPR